MVLTGILIRILQLEPHLLKSQKDMEDKNTKLSKVHSKWWLNRWLAASGEDAAYILTPSF
jgi:hypothetical protein